MVLGGVRPVLGGCQTAPRGSRAGNRSWGPSHHPDVGPAATRRCDLQVSARGLGVLAFRAQAGSASVEHVDARPAVASREVPGDLAAARIHASDESVDPSEIEQMILAQAFLLQRLAGGR